MGTPKGKQDAEFGQVPILGGAPRRLPAQLCAAVVQPIGWIRPRPLAHRQSKIAEAAAVDAISRIHGSDRMRPAKQGPTPALSTARNGAPLPAVLEQ